MPEEKRVFDVSKPGRTNPPATSKPVIVGHQPMMSDPMVRDSDEADDTTRITVRRADEEVPVADKPAEEVSADETPEMESAEKPREPVFPQPDTATEALQPAAANPPEPETDHPPAGLVTEPPSTREPAINPPITYDAPAAEAEPAEGRTAPPPADQPEPPVSSSTAEHVEGLHVAAPKRRRSRLSLLILIILILLIAAYLLIDSGVISTSIKLPFHIFKQKTPVPAASPPAATSQNAGPSIPVDFTQYKIAGTSITFAAPTAWGTPTSTTEQGYTARGGTNKPDGTYAYIVDFANNKDVEIAVTSSQYLPPARTTLYYDYLRWCTGTNDGKIYLSILHFTTANSVDTPSTIACDQGPLTDVSKLNSTTIVQLQAKYQNGQLLGDLYTKNLLNSDLPVFRVKDAKSANSEAIKQLLATVQEPAATTNPGANNSSSP